LAAITKIEPRHPIAVVRLDDLSEAVPLCRALIAGGMRIAEFTLTCADAPAAITRARGELGSEMLVGAGTVLDKDGAKRSIDSGAQFLVTPIVAPDVITTGIAAGIPVVCGAMTPTEIHAASQAGAEFVKIFPAGRLGPSYLKDILGPLPGLKLVPTGGIDVENCAAFLNAGAYTVAIGSNLVSKKVVAEKDWPALTALARKYVEACNRTD
jgi:2-dehydro-3-deoxyphosphogluconate aldolase/(4S)-4-hydroxy-2-oxoglutarate aldolase